MTETSDSGIVSTRQRRIAQLAKQMPEKGLTSLNQHLDLAWLREAYRRTRKDGAVGVDGQTAADYEKDLEGNLRSLLERAKSGTYWAPPVRRVHIPKGTGGETRPIGIPTLEDKVLQRAVVMLLEPIYEQDFYDCSFGFRPRRSAHDALDSLWKQTHAERGKLSLGSRHPQVFRHAGSCPSAGVSPTTGTRWCGAATDREVAQRGRDGSRAVTHPEAGSPQGGVISPVLANVYLHYVLDQWFAREVQPRLKGRAYLVRYADDFVIGFTDERGCAARNGRAAEAIRQVRPDDPPGQDPAGAVPQAERRADATADGRPWDVRLSGVHALLGALPEGQLGSEAEDGGQPVHAGGQDDLPLVPAASPRSD